MRIRPWTYLAIIATVIIWGLPGVILWLVSGVMLVDLAAGWVHSAAQRLDRSLREPLTEPLTEIVPCRHPGAVEVRQIAVPAVGVTDDVVAHYCPGCKTQLPADWAYQPPPERAVIKVGALNAEQRARHAAAFLHAQRSSTPSVVWVDSGEPVRHVCDPVRCRTAQQIIDSGREAVDVTAVGDPHRMWIEGEPLTPVRVEARRLPDG